MVWPIKGVPRRHGWTRLEVRLRTVPLLCDVRFPKGDLLAKFHGKQDKVKDLIARVSKDLG